MIWLPVRQRLQSELIRRGHCVGCARSLAGANRTNSPTKSYLQIVTCSCQRIYIYDTRINSYRRALPHEAMAPSGTHSDE